MFLPVIDNEAYNLIDAPKLTGTPERRLLLALLERAILDFVGNDTAEIEQAEAWIFSDLEDPDFLPFTFSWVCQQLDLDHQSIARTIKEMPRRGTRRVAPWYFARQEKVRNSKNTPEYSDQTPRQIHDLRNPARETHTGLKDPANRTGALRLIHGKGRNGRLMKRALNRSKQHCDKQCTDKSPAYA